MRYLRQLEEEPEEEVEPRLATPPRKQVKLHSFSSGRKGSSVLAQSVPDFSAALRKENRNPLNTLLPSVMETTPPSKSFSKGHGVLLSNSRGSKSANAGEKGGGGGVLMARKSYVSIDELKSLSSSDMGNGINGGEGRGGRYNRVMGKTLLGNRQF